MHNELWNCEILILNKKKRLLNFVSVDVFVYV